MGGGGGVLNFSYLEIGDILADGCDHAGQLMARYHGVVRAPCNINSSSPHPLY